MKRACLLLTLLMSCVAMGADQDLFASDFAAGDRFGDGGIDMDGSMLISSAKTVNKAYVFSYSGSGYVEEGILTTSSSALDNFGVSAGISGDVAVVGADREAVGGMSQAGSAYVFRKTAGVWQQEQVLQPSSATTYGHFGSCVSVDGDRIVVGATGIGNGTVSIFEYTGSSWVLDATLSGSRHSGFGYACDTANGVIAVGAPYYDVGKGKSKIIDAGYASVYEYVSSGPPNKQGWKEKAKFVASVPERRGYSVSIDGTRMLVGSPKKATSNGVGAAILYSNAGGWTQTNVYEPSSSHSSPAFGFDVALGGDFVVIGAELGNEVPVYSATTHALLDTVSDNTAGIAQFGRSVGVSNGFVAAGSGTDSTLATIAGKVFVSDQN